MWTIRKVTGHKKIYDIIPSEMQWFSQFSTKDSVLHFFWSSFFCCKMMKYEVITISLNYRTHYIQFPCAILQWKQTNKQTKQSSTVTKSWTSLWYYGLYSLVEPWNVHSVLCRMEVRCTLIKSSEPKRLQDHTNRSKPFVKQHYYLLTW